MHAAAAVGRETLNRLESYKEPRTGIIGKKSEISPCSGLGALVRNGVAGGEWGWLGGGVKAHHAARAYFYSAAPSRLRHFTALGPADL